MRVRAQEKPLPPPSRLPHWITSHVRSFDPDEVTDLGDEADPRLAGLTHDDVEAMWGSVVSLYKTGLHPALQLCVRRRGVVVLDRAVGHVRGNSPTDRETDARPVRVRHDSLFNLFSAAKAVTAMVVHLLDERGLVHLDDAVAEYIPEFARHGKHRVTLRHVLTHRAGIPSPGRGVTAEMLTDPDRILAHLCDAKLASVPGRRLAYHAVTGGYLLAEVVRRVTGRDLRTFFRDEVLKPLGFRHFTYGVPLREVDKVAVNAFTGTPPLPPFSQMLSRSLGVGVREAVELSNSTQYLTSLVPSACLISSANEASRFFELLLRGGELDGVRIFDPRTVRRAVAEQSYLEIDSFLGMPIRYGMGFMLGGNTLSLYGARTPRAFGHIGFTTVVAWADPDRDLSACLMSSGKPFITLGQIPWLNVARTISKRTRKK